MNLFLSFMVLTVLFLGITNYVDAFGLDAEMMHGFRKPLHQMLIEDDLITIDLTVQNNLNATKNYVINLNLKPVNNPELTRQPITIPYTLAPFEKHTFTYHTNLIQGQWILSLDLHTNSTNCCHIHGYQTAIMVHTVEDLTNILTVIGTIVGAVLSFSVAILAIILQQKNNRRAIVESRVERKETLEEMSKQRKISGKALDLAHKEFEGTVRPWISISNIEPSLVNVKTNTSDEFNINWNEYWKDQSKFPGKITAIGLRVEIKNIGKIPAMGVTSAFLQSEERLEKGDVTHATCTRPQILLPGENLSISFVLTIEEYERIGKQPQYFGVYVQYHVNEKTKGIGKTWIYDGGTENIESWIEEDSEN